MSDLATGLRGSVAAAHEGDETKVVAAYEAYSKGLLNIRADTYESLDRAILLFERALALDPDYIRAQIELGAAYAQKGDYLVAPEYRERSIVIRSEMPARSTPALDTRATASPVEASTRVAPSSEAVYQSSRT